MIQATLFLMASFLSNLGLDDTTTLIFIGVVVLALIIVAMFLMGASDSAVGAEAKVKVNTQKSSKNMENQKRPMTGPWISGALIISVSLILGLALESVFVAASGIGFGIFCLLIGSVTDRLDKIIDLLQDRDNKKD